MGAFIIRGHGVRCAFVAVVLLVLAAPQVLAQAPTGGLTIHRPQDPVVITGGAFSLVDYEYVADLRLYAFDGNDWVALPFQVDEVTGGLYVSPGTDADDGGTAVLDADDELVFMGFDAGTAATCADSANLLGGPHLRERVTILDPLTGDEGVAYLFVQPALPPSPASYIDWNSTNQTMAGAYNASYELDFGSLQPTPFVGINNLAPNGGTDILDRMKTRVDVDATVDIGFGCGPLALPVHLALDEETLVDQGADPTVSFTSVGAVRAVQSSGIFAFYGSRLDTAGALNPGPFEVPPICPGSITVNLVRFSFDLNNPLEHGVDTYHDSNGATATIDGTPDAVPNDPMPTWSQVNGNAAGLGGLVQVVSGVDVGTGAASGFYVDDAAAGGTGDGASFGEFGQDLLGNGVAVMTSAYILPPGTDVPVGETYLAGAVTLLQATTVVEDCTATEPPWIFDDGFESGDTSAW